MKYDYAAIEKKWQAVWEREKPFRAETGSDKPKFYGLIEFPYPSAAAAQVLHGDAPFLQVVDDEPFQGIARMVRCDSDHDETLLFRWG